MPTYRGRWASRSGRPPTTSTYYFIFISLHTSFPSNLSRLSLLHPRIYIILHFPCTAFIPGPARRSFVCSTLMASCSFIYGPPALFIRVFFILCLHLHALVSLFIACVDFKPSSITPSLCILSYYLLLQVGLHVQTVSYRPRNFE